MINRVVLGVDGGATKTVCVVMASNRAIIGEGRSGSSNRNSVGDEAAHVNLAAAIDDALKASGCSIQDIAAICVGISGVNRPLINGWLAELAPDAQALIYGDAAAALASGTGGDLYGVVVISGTSMIVWGMDRAGQKRIASGWGPLLTAHGSGYAIGVEALRAITRAVDGVGPPTTLHAMVFEYLGLQRPLDLVDWTYQELTWARFADLAPLVMRCCEQGDQVATHIIEKAACGLTEASTAVILGLGFESTEFPLVVSGGNLRPGPLLDRFAPQVQKLFPKARLIRSQVEPAVGAAWLALKAVDA